MRQRNQVHGSRYSWVAGRMVCLCGNHLPCLAGDATATGTSAAAGVTRTLFPAPPPESETVALAHFAQTLLNTHQRDANGYCRAASHGDLRRHPCSIRDTALRRLAHFRTVLALLGVTEVLPTLSGTRLNTQVAYRTGGW